MTFKVTNEIAASDIPILHDPIVTNGKMMSGIWMDGQRIHTSLIRNVQMLNGVNVPVNDFVSSRKHEILTVVRPADPVDRSATRCDRVLRLTAECHVPASDCPVDTR